MSRLDFSRRGGVQISKMSTTTTSVQEEYKVWIKISKYSEERRRAEMNFDELVETLMGSTVRGKGKTHQSC